MYLIEYWVHIELIRFLTFANIFGFTFDLHMIRFQIQTSKREWIFFIDSVDISYWRRHQTQKNMTNVLLSTLIFVKNNFSNVSRNYAWLLLRCRSGQMLWLNIFSCSGPGFGTCLQCFQKYRLNIGKPSDFFTFFGRAFSTCQPVCVHQSFTLRKKKKCYWSSGGKDFKRRKM